MMQSGFTLHLFKDTCFGIQSRDYTECKQSDLMGADWCNKTYGAEVRRPEQNLELLQKIPDIKIVKYRTIDTDVNGDKKASGYKYVSCIPKGDFKIDLNGQI